MPINRVQFQKGFSLGEFMMRYGTEEQCVAALEQSRWPSGFVCPSCRDTRHSVFVRDGRRHFQCCRCRHQATLTAGTIFADTKLPLRLWFLAMYLLTQSKNNVSALELMRHLGVGYRTAWRLKQKLMTVMAIREERRVLTGRVEIDDAYLGGEKPGRRGRGSQNKVPFVIAVQTCELGRPRYMRLAQLRFTGEDLSHWANQTLAPDARIVSDGLHCFRAADAEAGHVTDTFRSLRQNSIWMSPALGDGLLNTTGTKLGVESETGGPGKAGNRDFAATPSRSCTQRRSRFALSPCASATAAIDTPGRRHAATTLSLNPSECRRLRIRTSPTSVIMCTCPPVFSVDTMLLTQAHGLKVS